jgi:hypothetical protein
MSIRSKARAAAAVVTMVGGLCAVGTPPAGAATPQCGPHCIQIFSAKFGTPEHPRFVESVFRGIAKAGVPTGLRRVSGNNAAGDMIVGRAGMVSDFYAAGMVSAAVNNHYGNLQGVQIGYAARGKPTGLCAAVATTAYQNERLTLQPCSTPATTVFIIDTADSPGTAPTYFPILNASTTDFAHPFAMTIDGNPARERFLPIRVRHLSGHPGHVPDNQLWGSVPLN